jgi:acyl-[acyl-carrier-protein]-phospholipid O-acyltransferase/long-chain-fatty-acid--[acyl-carrier-protein] ligase
VIAVNRPGAEKVGAVGRLVGGLEVRTVDEETRKNLSKGESGILEFRGPNIFPGYLGRPDLTQKILQDGWYHSADFGRVDEDGFLTIEGRRARFSKVGGEMVPHGLVEEHLLVWLKGKGMLHEGLQEFMVTAVEDERKGESLVVLHSCEIDPTEAEKALRDSGVPNLWIPRKFIKVKTVPILASGKLDLAAARKITQNG